MNQVLKAFFDPDLNDPQAQAGLREEFVRALDGEPQWAIHRAFDDWMRTRVRRPSPGEIMILVNQHLDPLRREIARRKKIEERREEADREADRNRCSKQAAQSILDAARFTPKRFQAMRDAPMASTFEEAEAMGDTRRASAHWSETASPDSPQMEALRKSRAANPLVQASLESQRQREEKARIAAGGAS